MLNHTMHEVSEITQANWESDLPDKVLEALRPFENKLITSRMLKPLKEKTGVEWLLERAYGMTHLKTRDYLMSQGNNGVSLLLGHSEASFPLVIERVREKNPAYFSARLERNHARMELRNTRERLESVADLMNRTEEVIERLHAIEKEWSDLFQDVPDYYRLKSQCGWYDEKGNTIINHSYHKRREPIEVEV